MKRERFPHPSLYVESFLDGNGRVFVCCDKGTSRFCDSRKEVLRFLQWPTKTPTGDALRAWLSELEAADIQRKGASLEQDEALLKATGFGPEQHLEESDPNYQTRTVL
jgi:hypothetical protein